MIDAEEFRAGPTGNLQDVLEFAPGVYGQDRFGGDEIRLSIRGSGISQPFAVKGIRLLRDGLPISEADGDFHSQLVDPLIARYVEVYRGANALQYGASTLGGAINFVSYTGYTASPLTARLELGSDSFIRPQLSGGAVLGGSGLDVFASLSGTYYDGFRDHAETHSTRFYGNLGYRHSGRAESRVHVSVQDNNQELPGDLTKAELKNDPTQASAFFKAFNSQNDFDRYRVDFQHTIRSEENDRLDFGAFYETQEIDHPLPFYVINEDQDNYGLSLRQELHGRVGTRNSRFVWGGTLALGDIKLDEFEPLGGGERGALRVMEDSDVLTSDLFAEGQLQVAESFTVILGAQLAYSERETDFNRPDPTQSTSIENDYFGFSPKLGLLWQAADSVQVFGNVSRSFEPP
ncbi:MAG: TonB-dependent receptor domain-containing protein, partial [Burkholderiales bacterium]